MPTTKTPDAGTAEKPVDTPPPSPEPSPPELDDDGRPDSLAVSDAAALTAEFDRNEVRADANFKGKLLAVRGTVESVGKDLLGTPYVSLKGPENTIFGVQCLFKRSEEHILAPLNPGQFVTIAGTCAGKMGNVLIRDCWFYVSREEKETEANAAAKAQADREAAVRRAEEAEKRRIEEARQKKENFEKSAPQRAADLLKAAKRFSGDLQRKWLQKVADEYPETEAGKEAAALLEEKD